METYSSCHLVDNGLGITNLTGNIKQMNILLALDTITSDQLENLAPHKNMYDLNKPRTLAKTASLPKPVVSTISNWLHYDNANMTITDEQQKFLESVSI